MHFVHLAFQTTYPPSSQSHASHPLEAHLAFQTTYAASSQVIPISPISLYYRACTPASKSTNGASAWSSQRAAVQSSGTHVNKFYTMLSRTIVESTNFDGYERAASTTTVLIGLPSASPCETSSRILARPEPCEEATVRDLLPLLPRVSPPGKLPSVILSAAH